MECETLDDVMSLLESGSSVRHTGSTQMNEQSSRSHSVFTVNIGKCSNNDQWGSLVLRSWFYFSIFWYEILTVKTHLLFLGQKWSENDVMAEKRKQSESTESLDEGAFHLNFISWMCIRDFSACMWMFFFCNQYHIMHFHRILVKSDFRGQYFFVFNVFCCYVVFVFLMIILLLEVLQILTLNSRYLLCSKTLICYVHVLLNHKNTCIYIVHVPVILTVKQTIRNIDIGVDIILSKWESSENQSSLFSGESSSKGLLFGTVLTCNYAMS